MSGDAAKRWDAASRPWWFDSMGDRCSFCHQSFESGDVAVMFGDPNAGTEVVRLGCRRCGLVAVTTTAEGRQALSGAFVFIEARHSGVAFDRLSAEQQERIEDGFRTLDRLMAGIRAEGAS
jgi:hypothetical protein